MKRYDIHNVREISEPQAFETIDGEWVRYDEVRDACKACQSKLMHANVNMIYDMGEGITHGY